MRPPHTQFHESLRLQFPFVFRRLQSLQLLLPARPCFLFQLALSFLASLGFHFHGLAPFPLLFLTSAVFAPFRSLQFWILTTQPLFFLSALFTLPPHSCFHAAPSFLSSLRSFLFSPGWFPVRSFRFCLLGFAVRFLSPFPDSLPQLFLRCLLPAFAFRIFRFPSAFFRPLLFCFRLLSLLFLPFRSSRFCLTVADPVPHLRSRFLAFPVPSRLVSHPFSPGFRTRLSVGFLSSFPASLPQLFHR